MALAWGTSLRRDALGEPNPAMATRGLDIIVDLDQPVPAPALPADL